MILYSVSKGLKDLHTISYSHRNLTLENIYLAGDKNYKIFNFSNASNKIFEKITERVSILFINTLTLLEQR